MAKQPIYVAAQELHGGTKEGKDGKVTPFVAQPNTVIDAGVQAKLGLGKEDVARLVDSGAIVEQSAYVASETLPAGQTAPGTTGTEFEGMSIDEMRKFLDGEKVSYPKDASAQDLMKIALEHQHPNPNSAASIEASMDVRAIKAELDDRHVPYEASANKATLAEALAQARAA